MHDYWARRATQVHKGYVHAYLLHVLYDGLVHAVHSLVVRLQGRPTRLVFLSCSGDKHSCLILQMASTYGRCVYEAQWKWLVIQYMYD